MITYTNCSLFRIASYWNLMAGERVLVRLSIFFCLLVATSCLKTATVLKEHTKNLTKTITHTGVYWTVKAQYTQV